jgi:riboflavin kinase/FMN adenylyltransferase
MRIFRGVDQLPLFTATTVTVGSFDGVHEGHRCLIDAVKRLAVAYAAESTVVTFWPHPRVALQRDVQLPLLTTLEEKTLLFERQGIDNLVVIHFTPSFSQLSSADFIRDILAAKLRARAVVMGYNHHFGHDGGRGMETYRQLGIEVHSIAKYEPQGQHVSSTAIREQIMQGKLSEATSRLGHPYLLLATAHEGLLQLPESHKLLPPMGCYPVEVEGVGYTHLHIEAGSLRLEQPLTQQRCIINFLSE